MDHDSRGRRWAAVPIRALASRRISARPCNENWAFRLNAMYENSDSYRDYVSLDRWAINPTATFAPNDTTTVKLSYEHLHDQPHGRSRNSLADSSGQCVSPFPLRYLPSTFFGNPNLNYALADVDIANAVIEHDFENGFTIKNASQYAHYDKFYQNIYPGGRLRCRAPSTSPAPQAISAPTTTRPTAKTSSTRPTSPTSSAQARSVIPWS